MGRRAASREESAARLRALTRRAYTASEGHLDLDDDAGREFDRIVQGEDGGRPSPPQTRRWAVSLRAAVVVLAVVAALAAVVVLRSLAAGSTPVPVPELARAGELDAARGHDGESAAEPAGEEGNTPADDGSNVGAADQAEDGAYADAADGTATARPPGANTGQPTSGTDPPPVLTVHVAGAVVAPGIVELPDGARVAQAIEEAGGAGPEAELAAVNLARPVQDGEQVYVPKVGEVEPGSAAGPGTAGPGAGPGSWPGTGSGASDGPGGTAEAGAAVDLNTADAAELDTLPGVGPAIAQRILDWRADHGAFHSVDELLEVSGIGPATLERLRERVRV